MGNHSDQFRLYFQSCSDPLRCRFISSINDRRNKGFIQAAPCQIYRRIHADADLAATPTNLRLLATFWRHRLINVFIRAVVAEAPSPILLERISSTIFAFDVVLLFRASPLAAEEPEESPTILP